MKYQLRIISGTLRGRKLTVTADPGLRPISDRAREALFSILGDAVPDRPFVDVFAGSGAVGMEALSRGAASAVFVERDAAAVAALIQHLEKFGIAKRAKVLRADAYRWADKWVPPEGPANVFLGPPYREFADHLDAIAWLIGALQLKLPIGSVLTLQSDEVFEQANLPDTNRWDVRTYGRTQLAIWVKQA